MKNCVIENLDPEQLREDAEWKRILESSFPKDELEDWDTVVRALEMGTGIALRATLQGKTIGISTLNWLTPHASFLGYIAVGPKSNGVGTKLLMENVQRTKEHYGADAIGMFAEMDRPDGVPPHTDEHKTRVKRLDFFKKNGSLIFDDAYRQPPLREGLPEVPLHLLCIPCDKTKKHIAIETRQSIVKAMYKEKYGVVNGISDTVLARAYESIWPNIQWSQAHKSS